MRLLSGEARKAATAPISTGSACAGAESWLHPSLFGEVPENLQMGPQESAVECGSAHIGGAKSIRLDDRRQPRRSASAVRNWAALTDIGYDDPFVRLSVVLDTGFGRRTGRRRIAL
jgi:hypothetical protein